MELQFEKKKKKKVEDFFLENPSDARWFIFYL